MPRFAANIGFLFAELPFLERFRAAARAGFTAVEFADPYRWDWDRIADLLAENGLAQVLVNSPPGDKAAGESGLACLPGREAAFQESVGRVLDYAGRVGCPRIHLLAGILAGDAGRARRTYVDNLRFAARAGAERGVKILIEPINTGQIPGYFMSRPELALEIIEEAAEPNLFLQFDFHHAQITQGNLAATVERALPLIAHMQIADVPGRHEPGTGEINFPFLFGLVDRLGYAGWIGCEFHPSAGTEAALAWARPYLGGGAAPAATDAADAGDVP